MISNPATDSSKKPRIEEKSGHENKCGCGKRASEFLRRQSAKNPKRVGQRFYKCPDEKCKFWAWKGDPIGVICKCGYRAILLEAGRILKLVIVGKCIMIVRIETVTEREAAILGCLCKGGLVFFPGR